MSGLGVGSLIGAKAGVDFGFGRTLCLCLCLCLCQVCVGMIERVKRAKEKAMLSFRI